MHGALYVVENLEEYLRQSRRVPSEKSAQDRGSAPQGSPAATEWKLADLASDVENFKPGRSYGNGKAMFKVANCIACHRWRGRATSSVPTCRSSMPSSTSHEILKDILGLPSGSTRNIKPG